MTIKFYSKLLVVARDYGGAVMDHFPLTPDWEAADKVEDAILDTEDLAQYADYDLNPGEVISITLTLEKSGDMYDDYWLVANCVLGEGITPDTITKKDKTVKEALKDYLEGQYSDGWGEGFSQDEFYTDSIEDEYADPNDYADEDGEIPDDWEDMVEDIDVYYYVNPWWSKYDVWEDFKFDMIKVED